MLKLGLVDFLESYKAAGLEDWGLFSVVETVLPQTELQHTAQTQHSSQTLSEPMIQQQSQQTPLQHSPPEQTASDDSVEARNELLRIVATEVCDCRRCAELATKRTQTVFGDGNPLAQLVFIGEAPGADEDKAGVPFVGRAGQLLNDIISKGMGLAREDVYICNILRCRPPGNRNPQPDEAAKCREFLDRTLDIVKPEFICCLGAIASQNLLQNEKTIGQMRGAIHNYRGVKVVCTYHPAYLLRNPSAKKETWKDIQLLMKLMGITLPTQ
ncbi:MAG: uracil-DNA glycosylase [Planctomycetaceae bacterium]|jgi:DNA polymerase|nr:uracil-DNA glycosylase [Planctomycetaceae bacterium]